MLPIVTMKKLDKLILSSFIGPFILTFLVVDFILLIQYMLKYFDEFVGKNLGFAVFAEMILYFCINMTPIAFPLAILLSSLMTYGTLGENFELTAIKSSGISLLRTLRPIFVFVILLTIGAYFSNNYIVPRANLNAFRLLYDIRQTKPALDIKEGIFYGGIPNYSIKVNEKFPDGETIKDLIIYDHTKGLGNTEVILADSGRMYTIDDEAYLMLEMYDGMMYSESRPNNSRNQINQFTRNQFEHSKLIFSLASFDMKETNSQLFASNKLMKTSAELVKDVDSMATQVFSLKYKLLDNTHTYYTYHLKEELNIPEAMTQRKNRLDSLDRAKLTDSADIADFELRLKRRNAKLKPLKYKEKMQQVADNPERLAYVKKVVNNRMNKPRYKNQVYNDAVNTARNIKNSVTTLGNRVDRYEREMDKFEIERYRKSSQAFACIVMFLIGAPVGAIIKRGGLGVPVILSIVFFIVFYVLSIIGAKWAKEGVTEPFMGVWAANFILMPFGFFFLWQARNDVRLLETDFYLVLLARIRKRFSRKKEPEN